MQVAPYPSQVAPYPTPASELVHLVTSFTDSLDALPPTLTRSLSDLKELDAVLSGSLSSITHKLQHLLEMMHTPGPTPAELAEGKKPKYTPLDRLKLLREVTEDARIFRLGGEDKIRVATATCETIATHTSHLAQLARLLMDYLPPSLLPQLPPPTAPHGYPASITPSTALARRQQFEYPTSHHHGAGSTSRMNAALGMVREHWELTRGRDRERPSVGKKREADRIRELQAAALPDKERKEKDPSAPRHPNQYTKKKLLASSQGGGGTNGGATQGHLGGMTAVDSVREKRKAPAGEAVSLSSGATSSRAGASNGNGLYPGMASAEEYNAATAGGAGGPRSQKRKVEDKEVASKRRKKGPEASPDVQPRQIPTPPLVTSTKPPRRTNSTKVDTESAAAVRPLEDEDLMDGIGDDDDGDGHTYCFCNRISFGEMIGCDGSDCEREWFHLSCVGLQVIPKGRWLCEDCRRRTTDKAKKRR